MKPLLTSIIVASLLLVALPCLPAERVLLEWDFSKAADTLGWSVAEPLKEFKVSDGALVAVAGPSRQKLESPIFEIPAKPWQYIELDLRTDADGSGLMYYSNTSEEPYHGFRPGQYATFGVRGDGSYHTYTIRPFWQKQGKITHIRFDPPGTNVHVRAVRIIDSNLGEPSNETRWEFNGTAAGWQPLGWRGRFSTGRESWQVEGNRDVAAISPAVNIDTDEKLWATIRMASRTDHTAVFRWATDAADGLQGIPINVRGDGMMHSYCIDLSEVPNWAGRVLVVGVTPTDSDAERTVILQSVALDTKPVGPAELQITRFGLADPITRVGEKAKLIVEVKNTGGSPAESVAGVATIVHKSGWSDQSTRTTDDARGKKTESTATWSNTNTTETLFGKRIARIDPGETGRFEWEFDVTNDADKHAVCRVTGPNLNAGEKQINLRFYPRLDRVGLAGAKYAPTPKPADTNGYEVGCYYFPGWHTYDRWAVLEDFPERRPVLGYYREGNPEVADWQVKWALEHGISFFIYDWYWSAGGRQLEQGLHDAFLKSRFRDKMKFCLLWANHNPAGTSSEEDCLKVTQYWIDNYFKLPNYLKVDGKNVMVIFSPHRLTEDMGHDGVKAAFVKMRKMCEEAGVGGLYLVACTYPGPEQIENLVSEGYDALSGYNYPSANNKGQQYAPYAWMVEGYREFWNQIADSASIPYIPVCEPGWDSRPWHAQKASVRTGKSPQLWQDMLENAKRFVDNPRRKQDGDKKLVFLEAWNEFGEGDYIEPHAEFGFDYLEAVREVFAPKSPKPEIVVPKDLGMGPYEIPRPEPRSEWDFSRADDQNWVIGNMKDFFFRDGVMRATAGNHDPAFYSPYTRIDANKLKTIEIRMRTDKGKEAQVFFSRPRGQMTEERSLRFPIQGDNQFHTYTLDMSQNRRWRGVIGQLRLDPNDESGSTVEIAYIRLK